MRKYIFLFLLLCFTINVLGQNIESSQTEQHQLVEWSKNCIKEFFNAISLSDTLVHEPIEWILIVQDARYPIKLKMKEEKADTLRGCIKLLDNRGVFDQYFEISEVPNAFIAVSLVRSIKSKRTGLKVESGEITFVLDNEGKVLEIKDYVRPVAIRQMTTMLVLGYVKQFLAENLDKDILKLEWKFQSDTQNWVLENDNKIIYQLTPLEIIYYAQKFMRKRN
ncbi:hypothetical protein [Bacteroides caecimuris]|uniref:hypothetical protein n=1 Tax=Bacteroides caecimuris TaxID=1796613 RepID=UPI00138EE1B7|nr:hypothetical protein [Bacteroides caecimuris]NDO59696.1 hypothetical protein [Bacteroides caecimuris]